MGETGDQLRPCFVSLSQTFKDNKQYDLAIKYFNEELNLNNNNPVEACKTTLSIAEVLEMKEAAVEEILKACQDARRLAQSAKDHKLETRALVSIIRVLNENNRLSDARQMEAELDNLKTKFGSLLSSSESESEEENTPDIGADICIDELSDVELEDKSVGIVRTRKKCAATKFKRNEKGESPLHTACISGNLMLVKKLLDQGHPVNVRDHNGWLPLHEACNFGYLEIVQELLDRGATVNDKGTEGCDGMTPLLDAACCGNLSVMELLLERGASPVMRTNKGETVLDCLIAWRKRYIKDENRDLCPETLSQYNVLVTKLRAALKKAGHKPETERRSPSPCPRSRQTSMKRSSKYDFSDRKTHKSGACSPSRRSIEEENVSLIRSFTEQEKMPKSSSNSLRRRVDDDISHQSTNATKEYEDAMKGLRRKPILSPSSPSPPPAENRSALIDEEELVNDWLVDDLGPIRGIKRRRPHQFDGEPLRRPNRLISPDRCNVRTLGIGHRDSLHPVSPDKIHLASNNSAQNQTAGLQQNEELAELTDLISSEEDISQGCDLQSIPRSTVPSTYQVPLSVFGVVHNTVTRQPETEQSAACIPPASHTLVPMPLPCTQTMQILSNNQVAPSSVKVRVEGKLLLIPLPSADQCLPIAWLADEAAKRYYSFEGVEPKLNLATEDGAMLAPQDPVTLLLSYREVTGVVTSWKMHPVTERYRDACSELGIDVDEYLERCLDISQASFSLNLKGCSVDAEMVNPVFRASTNQTSLQHLILSDNRLGDAGMQLVAKLVTKLPHLRELDLTCNGITYEGLNIFVHQTIEHQTCKRLETLKLCHNQLGKSCVKLLSQLFQVTKSLTNLSLASVGIPAGSFNGAHFLSLGSIEKLDVGHNTLGCEGVRVFLAGLSVGHITTLNLAHTGAGVPGVLAEWLSGNDPCRLHTLNIAYCTDRTSAFSRLISCLEKAPLLEHLEITCPDIDEEFTMIQSLYQLPLRVLRLPGVRVSALPSYPPPIHELSCLSLSTDYWTSQGPFGLLTNNNCYSN